MSRFPLIKTCWVMIAALFLMMQGFAQVHAASHDCHDHSHEGVPCDVAVMAAEKANLTPPLESPETIIPTRHETFTTVHSASVYQSFTGRAPPPRGPPL